MLSTYLLLVPLKMFHKEEDDRVRSLDNKCIYMSDNDCRKSISAYLVVSGTRAGRVEVWVSLYSDVQVNVRADTQHTPLCQHSTHNTPAPVWVCQRWAGQWLTYFLINPKSVSPERGQATVLSKIWIVGIIRDTGPVSYFLLSTSELGVTWPPAPGPGVVALSHFMLDLKLMDDTWC